MVSFSTNNTLLSQSHLPIQFSRNAKQLNQNRQLTEGAIRNLWQEAQSNEMRQDIQMYSRLITNSCCHDRVNEAFNLFKQMRGECISADNDKYATHIYACYTTGETDRALDLLAQMQAKNALFIAENYYTLVAIYNKLLNTLFRHAKIDQALVLFKEMESQGVKPNKFTYTILITGLCNGYGVDLALQYLQKMKSKSVMPNDVTYTVLIKGLLKLGRINKAWALFEEMKSNKLKPNQMTYAIMIDGLCKFYDQEHDLTVFDELESSHLASDELPLQEQIASRVLTILNEVRSRHLKLDLVLYHILIQSLFKFGKIESALSCFLQMERDGVQPDKITYHTLIANLCQSGYTEKAFDIFKEVRTNQIKLFNRSYNVLIASLIEGGWLNSALTIFREMKHYNSKIDETLATSLVKSLYQKERLEEAFRLFEELTTEKFVIDATVARQLISSCSAKVERDKEGKARLICYNFSPQKVKFALKNYLSKSFELPVLIVTSKAKYCRQEDKVERTIQTFIDQEYPSLKLLSMRKKSGRFLLTTRN